MTYVYLLAAFAGGVCATDQMRQAIGDSAIVPVLDPQPDGVVVSFTDVTFTFGVALSGAEVLILDGLVAAHPGAGLPGVMPLVVYTVLTVPTPANSTQGEEIFVSDTVGGPQPAYFDGAIWRQVVDGAAVA